MWLETIRGAEDNAEKCPTCGGGVHRRVYGEMHAGAYVLNGSRVEIRAVPNAGFINPVLLDPITQYFDGGLYRLWPSERYFARGGKKLHREVWRVAFGDIPDGCHIHHKDSNPANNQLSNLECLPFREHLSETARNSNARNPRPFTQEARNKAAEWHRSEAGLLWHRRHAERVKEWIVWARKDMPCVYCGKIFKAFSRSGPTAQKYCSEVCRIANYRKRKAASRTR